MLVLSVQTAGLVILHGPELPTPIELLLVDVRGDKVRLGITAAKSIAITRKENLTAEQRKALLTPQPAPAAATEVAA